MLRSQLYSLLFNFLLLMNQNVLASSPDDYFGQAEAEYDYYDGEYFDAYEDVDRREIAPVNNDLVSEDLKYLKDATSKEHVIIASKYIGEIDARGSTITIHDSDRRDQNYDKNKIFNDNSKDHVEDLDSESSPVSIESEEGMGSEEDVENEEDIGSQEDVENDEIEVESGEEIKNEKEVKFEAKFEGVEKLISEEDIEGEGEIKAKEESLSVKNLLSVGDGSKNILPPITIKNFGSEDTFVDKLQGLQMGMDAMVTILKEIAGKVGCPLAKIQNDIPRCPAPFTKVVSGECLYADLENKLSWTAARSACNKMGADLVYPLNNGEDLGFLMGLKQHIDVPKSPMWVGGSDRQHEGVWRWVDGRATPTNLAWSPGQPRHISGREDCMALSFVDSEGLKASNCLIRKNYVCQKKI